MPPGMNRIYRDLNRDGFSEMIINGEQKESKIEFISLYNSSGKLINQFNFSGQLLKNGIIFGDLNQDKTDDIILFYKSLDTLFFDVIDGSKHEKIAQRVFFMTKPDSVIKEPWDVGVVPGSLTTDVRLHEKQKIILGLSSGFSIYPRGIYIFNLFSGIVESKFESTAPIAEIFYLDIDQDYLNEIVSYSHATANLNTLSGYHDHTSWLFIFNNQLDLIKPAHSFGSFPEGITLKPVSIDRKGYLLLSFHNKTSLVDPTSLRLLDYNGNLEREKKFPSLDITNMIEIKEFGKTNFIISLDNGRLLFLNQNLEERKSLQLDFNSLTFGKGFDIDKDGTEEILCFSDKGFFIINSKLELLLKEKIDNLDLGPKSFSIKYNGLDSQSEILIGGRDKYYLVRIIPNLTAKYLYIIVLGIFFAINFILFYLKRIIQGGSMFYLIKHSGINFISDGILLLNPRNKILMFNLSLQNIFNVYIEKGNDISVLIGLQNVLVSELQKSRSKEGISELELPLDIDQEENHYLKIIIFPLKLFRIINLGYFIVFKSLKQNDYTDKFKVWSRSVQKIAHDIKTPLSTVLINLQTLKLRVENNLSDQKDDYFNDIDIIQNEVERIKILTKDFLKFIDLDKPKLQPIQVNDIVDKSLNRFMGQISKDLKFEIDLDRKNNFIIADPVQIELVLHILIENSIDAIKSNGIIRLATDLYEDMSDQCKKYMQFELSDDGEGIEKELINKIFDAHFTTKMNGSGLGLAMAKKIIEDHQGRISVISRRNFGTTFRFIIPTVNKESIADE